MNTRQRVNYILIAIAVCIPTFFPESSAADPLDNWHPRNVLTDRYLRDVTYGNNTFVIVGGGILTSKDGISWNEAVAESGWRVNAVTWGKGLFLGVGSDGIIVTSRDAKTWKSQTAGYEYSLTDVVFGNGIFVAVGHDTQRETDITLTSTDGSAWKLGSSSVSLAAITFGNGLFVGVESSSYGKIHTSPNGVNWTTSFEFDQSYTNLWGVSYSNNMFLAFGRQGNVLLSTDGVNWTVENSVTPISLNDVYFGNDRFIGVGDYDYESRILSSQDGINWKYVDLPLPYGHLQSVIYGNGTFIAVGQYGTILSSEDGEHWFARSARTNLRNAAYGNGLFIGVSGDDRTIISSQNGISWTSRTELIYEDYLSDVTFGDGKFVAVGVIDDHNAGLILTSSDGIEWEETLRGTVSRLKAVGHGKGIFVAVGENGLILTSRDGVRWTARYSNTTSNLLGVAYGNDIFVAVGEGGAITTSSDGIEWRAVSSGTVSPLEDAAFGNGLFVAVSSNFLINEHDPEGIILSSSDGVNWKSAAVPTSYYITGIAFGGGYFTAVGLNAEYCSGFTGYCFVGGPAILLTSSDGMNWEERYKSDNASYSGVAFGNNTFIVLGGRNLILQSDPLSGKCTAIVSADLSLRVPIINFDGAYIWYDAQCEINASDSMMCRATGYGTANSADFNNCQSSVLTADMKLHIPFVTFKNLSYQADFEYVPTADGKVWFSLTDADRN